jgi:xanthine/uracil/vitamin C permease (AzgA family)
MSGKHRVRTSKSNLIVGSIAASVGVSSVLAAAIVELVEPDAPTAARPAPQATQAQQPLTQQGRLVAVTADSLTTQSADGSTHTYAVTPNTTAITDSGQSASPAASFTVDDVVTVVGSPQGGTVVATAVADQSAVGPQGRPMDYGV